MLSISGFDSEIITDFSLTKRIYCHSQCNFKINICDKSPESFLSRLGNSITISISGKYIFCGYITEISAAKYFSYTEIIVKAVSYSMRHDQKPEKRIFQNPRKTFRSIIAFLGQAGNLNIELDDQTLIPQPILQCEETDFSFIIRMSQTYRKIAFINDDENSPKVHFIIGTILDEAPIKIKYWEKISFIEHYNVNMELQNKKHQIVELILREQYIRLGQKVKIGNETKYVADVEIFKENGIFKYKYKLYDLDMVPVFETPKFPKQIALKAVTTDNNDTEFKGRIKVCFTYSDPESGKQTSDYSDIEPGEGLWIPYHTPYFATNGGLIFLPDKGDFVEVIYNDNSFSAYGILGTSPLKEDFRIPQNKYIANIYGKQIIFKEDSLEIRSNNNTIILSDESLSFNIKDNKLIFNANGFEVQIGKTNIQISDSIIMKTKAINSEADSENTKVTSFQIDSQDTINIKSKKNITIQGQEIHLK